MLPILSIPFHDPQTCVTRLQLVGCFGRFVRVCQKFLVFFSFMVSSRTFWTPTFVQSQRSRPNGNQNAKT